jgi:hypothetical protein
MALHPIDRLALLTPDQADALRARLTAVGYDDTAVARGESIAPGLFDALRLPLVHDALPLDDAPASDLALLFAYSAPVPFARVERALTPPSPSTSDSSCATATPPARPSSSCPSWASGSSPTRSPTTATP